MIPTRAELLQLKLPTKPAIARAHNVPFYYSDKPCVNNHYSLRFSHTSECCHCFYERAGSEESAEIAVEADYEKLKMELGELSIIETVKQYMTSLQQAQNDKELRAMLAMIADNLDELLATYNPHSHAKRLEGKVKKRRVYTV
jgi:hypothetical protein